jgi:hypothetical protein
VVRRGLAHLSYLKTVPLRGVQLLYSMNLVRIGDLIAGRCSQPNHLGLVKTQEAASSESVDIGREAASEDWGRHAEAVRSSLGLLC